MVPNVYPRPGSPATRPPANPERLAWTHYGEGFIAFPRGVARFVTIEPHRKNGGDLTGGWQFTLHYDGRTTAGFAETRQKAADAANRYWASFIAQLAREEDERERTRAFHELIRAVDTDAARPVTDLDLGGVGSLAIVDAMRSLGDT